MNLLYRCCISYSKTVGKRNQHLSDFRHFRIYFKENVKFEATKNYYDFLNKCQMSEVRVKLGMCILKQKCVGTGIDHSTRYAV